MFNFLLSFAPFEQEATGERIRDKIAVSKAKGAWNGGPLPLSYDVCERMLIINEVEANCPITSIRMMHMLNLQHAVAVLNCRQFRVC